MATIAPEEHRALRAALLVVCIVVYVAAMVTLLAVGAEQPLRVLLEVRYALIGYCCIVVSCLGAMMLFVRRVPVAKS